MDTVLILDDCGHANPYHLFYYMIGQFKSSGLDTGANIVRYYYPQTDCELAEQALTNLPSRFVREFLMRAETKYIGTTVEFIDRIPLSDEQWIFQYIRDLYKHIWSQCSQISGKYTYISRSKATCRRILNEPEYTDALESIGVHAYCMEGLSFINQIKLFAESEIITGPHGAAYSFAAFCKPGTLIYEIYKADNIKCHYSILANECDLKYKRFYDIESFDERTHDMTIDKESYIGSLSLLIASRQLSGADPIQSTSITAPGTG